MWVMKLMNSAGRNQCYYLFVRHLTGGYQPGRVVRAIAIEDDTGSMENLREAGAVVQKRLSKRYHYPRHIIEFQINTSLGNITHLRGYHKYTDDNITRRKAGGFLDVPDEQKEVSYVRDGAVLRIVK